MLDLMTESLGILGGMGPLASAEFLKTIYECNMPGKEQASPACVLYSDPSMPDRTQAILDGSDDVMLERLTESLDKLCRLNVHKIVITCVTSHHLLPRLSADLNDKIISLVDLIVHEVSRKKTRCLLLCSDGTRAKRVFQQHTQWNEAKAYVVLPSDADQAVIHSLIYRLKENGSRKDVMRCLVAMLEKYELNVFIAGCTEFHLLTKHLLADQSQSDKYSVIDPLMTLARDLKSFTNA
jgi:aspartate racemase